MQLYKLRLVFTAGTSLLSILSLFSVAFFSQEYSLLILGVHIVLLSFFSVLFQELLQVVLEEKYERKIVSIYENINKVLERIEEETKTLNKLKTINR